MARQKDWKKEHDKVLKQLKALKRKYDIQKIYSDKIEKRLNVIVVVTHNSFSYMMALRLFIVYIVIIKIKKKS